MTQSLAPHGAEVSGQDSPERSIFHIRLRSGIWGVTLDGKFYGDFRGLRFALESAREMARELQAAGRVVHIVALSSGGAVLTSEVFSAL